MSELAFLDRVLVGETAMKIAVPGYQHKLKKQLYLLSTSNTKDKDNTGAESYLTKNRNAPHVGLSLLLNFSRCDQTHLTAEFVQI